MKYAITLIVLLAGCANEMATPEDIASEDGWAAVLPAAPLIISVACDQKRIETLIAPNDVVGIRQTTWYATVSGVDMVTGAYFLLCEHSGFGVCDDDWDCTDIGFNNDRDCQAMLPSFREDMAFVPCRQLNESKTDGRWTFTSESAWDEVLWVTP